MRLLHPDLAWLSPKPRASGIGITALMVLIGIAEQAKGGESGMGKFDSLRRFLEEKHSDRIALSFRDVERIIGEELCPSARKYHAYWRLSKTHMLPQAVDEAGYSIESVQLAEETVSFRRK